MGSHMPKLRKTDLIGLIGMVMLLVWTPTYCAQDEVQQDLTGGEDFRLPIPRDGDRVVLGLQIQERGGPVQTFGPVMELSFTALEPRATSTGGHAAFTTVHHPIIIETDLVSYASTGQQRSLHLDAAGRSLYRAEATLDTAEESQGVVTLHEVRGRTVSDCRERLPHEFTHTTYRYEPEPLALYLRHTQESVIDRPDPMDHCRTVGEQRALGSLNVVVDTGDHLLFGRHILRESRLLERLESAGTGRPLETCEIRPGEALFRQHGDNDHWGPLFLLSFGLDRLVSKAPMEYSCDVRLPEKAWHWISPGFPYPVGAHREILGPQGEPLLTLDLIPMSIERGKGATIPLARAEEAIRPLDGGEPIGDAPRLETITLRDLENTRPRLVHGITYADLREALATHAIQEVRDFIAAARLVRFEWDAHGPQIMTGENVDPIPVPIPTHPINEPVNRTELRSIWTVGYANGTGDVVTCRLLISIDETTDQMRSRVMDSCSEGLSERAHRPIPWDEALSDPAALLQDVPTKESGADWMTRPPHDVRSEFSWDGSEDTGASSWGYWHVPYDGSDRHVAWGQYNISNGYMTSGFTRQIISAPPEAPPQAIATTDGPTLQAIEPLARHLAIGGLMLIAIAMLGRLTAAWKSGALSAGAMALYAKIHKDAVLDNKRREAMLSLIERDLGCTLREVQSTLGYGWGSTVHHVETLIRNGLVIDLSVNRRRHLFPAATPLVERRRLAAERDPQLQPLLLAVQAHPGLGLRDLQQHVPRPESSLSRLGSRLEALGLVEKRKEGRTVRFYPTDATTAA